MRSVHLLLIFCVFFTVGTLTADDFAKFRIPKHRVYSLTGTADGIWTKHGANTNGTNVSGANQDDHISELSGTVNGSGYWLYDSDPLRVSTSASTRADGDVHNSFTNVAPPDWNRLRNKDENLEESWSLSTSLRGYLPEYIRNLPIGLSGSASASGSYRQEWTHSHSELFVSAQDQRSLTIHDQALKQYDYTANLSAGPGVGRVREVSSVYDVYVFEKRLKDDGVLLKTLSDGARQKLISLIYFEGDYGQMHDRPAKFFWQEVENILVADSAVAPASVNAYDLYRIAEPYFGIGGPQNYGMFSSSRAPRPATSLFGARRGILRQRGWFAGFMVTYTHTHDIMRSSTADRGLTTYADTVYSSSATNSSTHSEVWRDLLYYGPQVEYHLPWGMRWQFDGVSTFRTRWESTMHDWTLSTTLNAAYIITDRWYALAQIRHSYELTDGWSGIERIRNRRWFVDLGARVNYFIEDHTALYVSGDYNFDRNRSNNWTAASETTGSTADAEIRVGVSYRFLGKLSAPGIVPDSNLLPWRRY